MNILPHATMFHFRIMEESCSDSQNSIVFEGSSQDISNGGISFATCRSSNDSFGTGTKSHGAQGTDRGGTWEYRQR